jgi:hypothetical protein
MNIAEAPVGHDAAKGGDDFTAPREHRVHDRLARIGINSMGRGPEFFTPAVLSALDIPLFACAAFCAKKAASTWSISAESGRAESRQARGRRLALLYGASPSGTSALQQLRNHFAARP